jgi:hypothetical protein
MAQTQSSKEMKQICHCLHAIISLFQSAQPDDIPDDTESVAQQMSRFTSNL